MSTRKPPSATTPNDLHSVALDFIRRGQRAQAAVDAILAAEAESRRCKRPKGRA